MIGLVSVTFRALTPEQVVALMKKCSINTVEWGGDVHVPAGDTTAARRVRALCDANSINTLTYGSYYRVGASSEDYFDGVLSSAATLGAKNIRVWAHNKGSADINDNEYDAFVRDAQRICDMAQGFDVCFECHKNTLTDDYNSTIRLMRDISRDNVKMFWQPNEQKSFEYNLLAAEKIRDYTKAVHTFEWTADRHLSLADGAEHWQKYIDIMGRDVPYMLEFMPNSSPDELEREVRILKKYLER